MHLNSVFNVVFPPSSTQTSTRVVPSLLNYSGQVDPVYCPSFESRSSSSSSSSHKTCHLPILDLQNPPNFLGLFLWSIKSFCFGLSLRFSQSAESSSLVAVAGRLVVELKGHWPVGDWVDPVPGRCCLRGESRIDRFVFGEGNLRFE